MIQRGKRLEQRGKAAKAEGFYRAAAHAGDPEGMWRYANVLLRRREYASSVRWLRTAAEHGNIDAMLLLASRMTARGQLADAERWYREASERGSDAGEQGLASVVEEREKQLSEKRLREAERLAGPSGARSAAARPSGGSTSAWSSHDREPIEPPSRPKPRKTLGDAVADSWREHQSGWGGGAS